MIQTTGTRTEVSTVPTRVPQIRITAGGAVPASLRVRMMKPAKTKLVSRPSSEAGWNTPRPGRMMTQGTEKAHQHGQPAPRVDWLAQQQCGQPDGDHRVEEAQRQRVGQRQIAERQEEQRHRGDLEDAAGELQAELVGQQQGPHGEAASKGQQHQQGEEKARPAHLQHGVAAGQVLGQPVHDRQDGERAQQKRDATPRCGLAHLRYRHGHLHAPLVRASALRLGMLAVERNR